MEKITAVSENMAITCNSDFSGKFWLTINRGEDYPDCKFVSGEDGIEILGDASSLKSIITELMSTEMERKGNDENDDNDEEELYEYLIQSAEVERLIFPLIKYYFEHSGNIYKVKVESDHGVTFSERLRLTNIANAIDCEYRYIAKLDACEALLYDSNGVKNFKDIDIGYLEPEPDDIIICGNYVYLVESVDARYERQKIYKLIDDAKQIIYVDVSRVYQIPYVSPDYIQSPIAAVCIADTKWENLNARDKIEKKMVIKDDHVSLMSIPAWIDSTKVKSTDLSAVEANVGDIVITRDGIYVLGISDDDIHQYVKSLPQDILIANLETYMKYILRQG